MIKIASPLSKSKEVPILANAGANEFYCCVAPGEWRNSYGMVESISRRNNPFAHLSSYDELDKVLSLSRKYGIHVHVALNETYHREQMDYLLKQAAILSEMKVDAVILGDIASLLAIREANIPLNIFMGTGGTIFNSQTVKLYQTFGVKRMILPRHLNLDEIKTIIKKAPEPQYEVFIFRGLCPYIDGFCRFQHGINETLNRKPRVDLACALKYRVKTFEKPEHPVTPARKQKLRKLLSPRQSFTGCGLCVLYHMVSIPGITSLKIVGREFSTNEKKENLIIVKKFLDLAYQNKGMNNEEYIKQCKTAFSSFFEKECSEKDCYYPNL